MKVYKYREGNENDIEALINNYFYSPLPEKLNDPFETFVDDTSYKKEIDNYIRLRGKQNSHTVRENKEYFINQFEDVLHTLDSKAGYYSLSKSNLNEMMWALYANSHKGFCIEYDLNELLKSDEKNKFRYRIDVIYQGKPATIKMIDFTRLKTEEGKKNIYTKKSGVKSELWAHEQEIRILTDKIGKNSYNTNALKAVYFGVRMSDDLKKHIIDNLNSDSVAFYQMELVNDSYKLTYTPIK